MSIASTTTTTTSHRAALAGGITATLDPSINGHTLTLCDLLRALTLALTPEQLAEMATWDADAIMTGAWEPQEEDAPFPCTFTLHIDVEWFTTSARMRACWDGPKLGPATATDSAALRALAVAALAREDR